MPHRISTKYAPKCESPATRVASLSRLVSCEMTNKSDFWQPPHLHQTQSQKLQCVDTESNGADVATRNLGCTLTNNKNIPSIKLSCFPTRWTPFNKNRSKSESSAECASFVRVLYVQSFIPRGLLVPMVLNSRV